MLRIFVEMCSLPRLIRQNTQLISKSGIRTLAIPSDKHRTGISQNGSKLEKGIPITTENTTELNQSHIDEAINLQPQLSSATKQIWEQTHQVFINHGMTTKNFLEIIVKNPAVLTRSAKQNIESMEKWRSCQFGEKHLYILLSTYPELLDVKSERQILQRVTLLKEYVTTNKNVWKLLMNCPNLFGESTKSIEEKMDYMLETMRVETHEIVKSQALSKSLDEIRCRHVFLERLNLFTPRSLREDSKKPARNNLLHEITDTSDQNFSVNVARVSLEEYETFKELFAKELERKLKDEEEEED